MCHLKVSRIVRFSNLNQLKPTAQSTSDWRRRKQLLDTTMQSKKVTYQGLFLPFNPMHLLLELCVAEPDVLVKIQSHCGQRKDSDSQNKAMQFLK